MMQTLDNDDLPARATYQAACDARGVRPNWGASGYPSQASRWRAIADAARAPEEPPVPVVIPSPLVLPEPIPSDLSGLRIPMSLAIAILARAFKISETDFSRFAGNIKHYQRNGFPKRMDVRGRGSPAMLGRTQMLQLAVCEMLHRAGTMPIQAMRITESAQEEIDLAFDVLLSTDQMTPLLLVTWIDRHDERAAIHQMEDIGQIVGEDGLHSVTMHRLDTLVHLLRTAITEENASRMERAIQAATHTPGG